MNTWQDRKPLNIVHQSYMYIWRKERGREGREENGGGGEAYIWRKERGEEERGREGREENGGGEGRLIFGIKVLI